MNYEEVQSASPPENMREARACFKCKLVKSMTQFKRDGCENCGEDQGMSMEDVQIRTTPRFSGFVAVCDPKASWVARYLRLTNAVPGTYAITVQKRQERDDIDDMDVRRRNRGGGRRRNEYDDDDGFVDDDDDEGVEDEEEEY